MRQFWKKLKTAFWEFRYDRAVKQADRCKEKILELKFQSFTDEKQIERVRNDLRRMMTEFDKDDDQAAHETELVRQRYWN